MTRFADGREKHTYGLAEARALANRVVGLIMPYVDRVEIVGSIRRQRSEIHDVDIVAIPKFAMRETWFSPKSVNLLHERVDELIHGGTLRSRVKKDGKTMVGEGVAFVSFEGCPVDIYYAEPDTWAGLVLVRTGSAEHNIQLASAAMARGWHLHADGTGLFDAREGGVRIDKGTEESFFEALGIPYREPWAREVP